MKEYDSNNVRVSLDGVEIEAINGGYSDLSEVTAVNMTFYIKSSSHLGMYKYKCGDFIKGQSFFDYRGRKLRPMSVQYKGKDKRGNHIVLFKNVFVPNDFFDEICWKYNSITDFEKHGEVKI